MAVFNKVHPLNMKRFSVLYNPLGPNVSTTPIMAMECRQCLSLSVFQLKGKHCRNPVAVMGLQIRLDINNYKSGQKFDLLGQNKCIYFPNNPIGLLWKILV